MDKQVRSALNKLAQRQHGVFSSAQAAQIGVAREQLARAARSGVLRRVRQGVYAIGGTPPSMWEPALAAALAAGPGAVISHQSAAAVHHFDHASLAIPELTVPLAFRHRLPGALVHRSARLGSADVVQRYGARVTSPARTLIDLAPRLGPELIEREIDEGLLKHRLTVAELKACQDRSAATLRYRAQVLDLLALRAESPAADSLLEARAFRALRPLMPFKTHFVITICSTVYVLDAAWPSRRVAAEVVGRSHRVVSRSVFDRERRKLNTLAAAGWRVAHLTATMSAEEMVGAVRALFGA